MTSLAYCRRWTPRRAQRFCDARIDKIHNALLEIAGAWGEVDNFVVTRCDDLIEELEALRGAVKYATDHELNPDGECAQ